jgi:Na+/alanine symporter
VSGSALSTKGLISGGPGVAPAPTAPAATPPAPAQQGIAQASGPVVIVVPTAVNALLMVAENIVANLRAGQSSNLTLPSLYKRAYLISYETDEVAVVKP